MLLYHPHNDEDNYKMRDKLFREKCCIKVDRCQLKFIKERKINKGEGYSPPASGKSVFHNNPIYYAFSGGYYSTILFIQTVM